MIVRISNEAFSEFAGRQAKVVEMSNGRARWKIGGLDQARHFRVIINKGPKRPLWYSREEIVLPKNMSRATIKRQGREGE